MADPKRTKKRPQSGDRAADGKYRPGHKLPGPGRADGSRNKATIALEKMLADDGAGVVEAVIEKAKDGDMVAARLVLDRVPSRSASRWIPARWVDIRCTWSALLMQARASRNSP